MRSGGVAARHGACDDDQQADVPVADALGFPIGMGTIYEHHRRRHEAMYDEVPHRHGPGDSGYLWFRYINILVVVPPCPLQVQVTSTKSCGYFEVR